MFEAYKKLTQGHAFEKGELVLIIKCGIIANQTKGGKFDPIWKDRYIIEVYEKWAYKLVDMHGNHPILPMIGCLLKE